MSQYYPKMRLAISLAALAMAAALPALAQTSQTIDNRLTEAERNICQDLDMCVDILLRHDPESFDYTALAQEFQRFGAPAMQRLLQLVSSDREMAVKHAQMILQDLAWTFSPAAQQQIAKLWPRGDMASHRTVMTNIGTPLMRNRMISTLSHASPAVRQQSRIALDTMAINTPKTFTGAPVPPAAFPDLTKAVNDEPSPALITLIGSFPPAQSRPVLSQLLLAGDTAIVQAAYGQLYKQNPDAALSSFKAALPKLKTTDQILALSQLLQSRHAARQAENPDGFYMHLARGILNDKTLPGLANMMAMDAIMNSAPLEGKPLPKTPHVEAVFKALVTDLDVSFLRYAQGFDKKAGENTAQFLPIIWAEILRRDKAVEPNAAYRQRQKDIGFGFEDTAYVFMRLARGLSGSQKWGASIRPILRQGLTFDKDWRVQQFAALGLGELRDNNSMALLSRYAQSHPMTAVRAASKSALSGIQSGQMDVDADLRATEQEAQYCPVKAFDFRQDAKQLPFFEGGKFPDSWGKDVLSADRRLLSAAYPTQAGWLAGYNWGERGGGLLYYDNVTGDHEIITGGNIIAIIPVKPTPLGTFATKFWVIDGLEHLGQASARILYVKLEGAKITMQRHRELPTYPRAINVAKDQSLQIGFGQTHPPLRLLPNGTVISGCIPPHASALQSLPN